MDNRKELIDKILNELNDRSGFDDWWYSIDEYTQKEITETLVNILPTPDVVKSFTAEQVVNELEDCETLDDAIMFFKELGNQKENKALHIGVVGNCGDYAKNRPDGIQNDEWWCPNCNEIVPSHDVTNDERHGIDGCLTKVC